MSELGFCVAQGMACHTAGVPWDGLRERCVSGGASAQEILADNPDPVVELLVLEPVDQAGGVRRGVTRKAGFTPVEGEGAALDGDDAAALPTSDVDEHPALQQG
jgi:hypothetical protein